MTENDRILLAGGFSDTKAAAMATWQKACKHFVPRDHGRANAFRFPVRFPVAVHYSADGPALISMICEFWSERGALDGAPAYRILGHIPGTSLDPVELTPPTLIETRYDQ